jgi:hypothetical protein
MNLLNKKYLSTGSIELYYYYYFEIAQLKNKRTTHHRGRTNAHISRQPTCKAVLTHDNVSAGSSNQIATPPWLESGRK